MSVLNSDLLRTFLAVAEHGSFTVGAASIHRSQSAVSLQIKRLEDILGETLFDRHGRGVVLTPAGERLLPVARDIAQRLDDTVQTFARDRLSGRLHVGIPDDQSKDRLSAILGTFAQTHPGVELRVTCAEDAQYADAVDRGTMDVAVHEVERVAAHQELLSGESTHWMMSRSHTLYRQTPVPIALFDRDCWWRDAALKALEDAGRPYRIVYSSQSVAGIIAALEAGIAVGLLGQSSLTPQLRVLRTDEGFPDMPMSNLVLAVNRRADPVLTGAMADAIRQAFHSQRPDGRRTGAQARGSAQ